MIFQRLRVFVSSSMQELGPERQAVKDALDALKVDAWLFEQDAGARPESIQKAFFDEVEKADLYVGLFWKRYGEYTIEECEHARKLGKDCLVYEKRADLNGRREPGLQAFLDQLGDVKTGLIIKWFNTPDELTELVKNDLAQWQSCKIRERPASGIKSNPSVVETKERNELLVLLRKVKQFWVEGMLEHSVHSEALIDLGKERWIEPGEHPWEQILELADQTSRTLPSEQSIGKLFDDVGCSLLILGAPGSGKTITLLDLARDLIARAEGDPTQCVPVVFNLSSWIDPSKTMLDWLVEELLTKYQVPKRIGTRWLEQNRLLLLLDGLDEVPPARQSRCVEAINEYFENYGAPGLAVCSRLHEYTALPVRLRVSGAIRLQPLRLEQVKEYIACSGQPLVGLSAALEKDPILQSLAETPLLLDVMSLAYPGVPAEALANEALNTETTRQHHLFETYIAKMFIRKGKKRELYTRQQTIKWLRWLAQGMQQHGQTILLIEQLQPSWLTTQLQRVIYIIGSNLILRLIGGLLLGLIAVLLVAPTMGVAVATAVRLFVALQLLILLACLLYGLHDVWWYSRRRLWTTTQTQLELVILTVISGLIFGAIMGGLFSAMYMHIGLIVGLIFGLTSGLFYSSIRGHEIRNRSLTNAIKCVETLCWSWRDAQKGFLTGLITGFGVILILKFSFVLLITRWTVMDGLTFTLREPMFGLIYGLIFGTVGGLFHGVRRGLTDLKTAPNMGIKLTIRYVGVTAAAAFVAVGLIAFLGVEIGSVLSMGELLTALKESALKNALTAGSAAGFIAICLYGGPEVMLHYTLRFILFCNGHTPFHLARFLDYAARLIFLRRVGGGYIFIHRLLLEHFAAMTEDWENTSSAS